MSILVGDVGGTNTRLALATQDGAGFRLDQLQRHDTPVDLAALVHRYLAAAAVRPDAAAFCGAGPVRGDGSIALTNHACVLDPVTLAAASALREVRIANDFEAVAHAIPVLQDHDRRPCGGRISGAPQAAHLVIGAGTGLGVATLVPHRGDWLVLPGEGGHVDLAPVDDEEHAIWLALRRRHGALSAESLLSGPGLERLHEVLSGRPLAAPVIAEAARAGHAEALRSTRLFARWLGRVAGNAALTLGARGGVHLAGGIVPAWGEHFEAAAFRAGFEDKTGFGDWLAAIPSWIVTHPQPALIGLARLACRF